MAVEMVKLLLSNTEEGKNKLLRWINKYYPLQDQLDKTQLLKLNAALKYYAKNWGVDYHYVRRVVRVKFKNSGNNDFYNYNYGSTHVNYFSSDQNYAYFDLNGNEISHIDSDYKPAEISYIDLTNIYYAFDTYSCVGRLIYNEGSFANYNKIITQLYPTIKGAIPTTYFNSSGLELEPIGELITETYQSQTLMQVSVNGVNHYFDNVGCEVIISDESKFTVSENVSFSNNLKYADGCLLFYSQKYDADAYPQECYRPILRVQNNRTFDNVIFKTALNQTLNIYPSDISSIKIGKLSSYKDIVEVKNKINICGKNEQNINKVTFSGRSPLYIIWSGHGKRSVSENVYGFVQTTDVEPAHSRGVYIFRNSAWRRAQLGQYGWGQTASDLAALSYWQCANEYDQIIGTFNDYSDDK